MNICIAGKNNIAVNVCQYIKSNYPLINIIAVTNKNDNGLDGFQRSFKKYAKENGILIVDIEDVYKIQDLLFLSLEFDSIVNPELFSTTKLFNIHFSLLPKYKGMYTSALPILFGEHTTGVTLHCIDKGIDTGDIISQEEFIIDKKETCKSLYFKYIDKGTNLVVKNIESLIDGNYKPTPQSYENSTYFSKSYINYSNLQINLRTTANQISRQISAYNFRDYQLPSILGEKVVGCLITNSRSMKKPGTLLLEDSNVFKFSTIDYDIVIYKDKFSDVLNYCEKDDIDELISIPNIGYYIKEKDIKSGWSPLMVAAYNNSLEVFKFLIKKGSDINDVNKNGTTVIMYAKDAALRNNDYRIIDLCLVNGANPLKKDYKGFDLFDYLKNESALLFNYIKNKMK